MFYLWLEQLTLITASLQYSSVILDCLSPTTQFEFGFGIGIRIVIRIAIVKGPYVMTVNTQTENDP